MGSRPDGAIHSPSQMSQGPFTVPSSYSEWSDCLDAFEVGQDDAAILSAMELGSLEWTSGVAELFSERVNNTLNRRLHRCSDQLSRQLKTGADEVTLVRALLNTRSLLSCLYSVATLKPFPLVLQVHLASELKKFAQRTHDSLVDSAKNDRSGKLSSLIRNNSILTYNAQTQLPAAYSEGDESGARAPTTTRRRNILA